MRFAVYIQGLLLAGGLLSLGFADAPSVLAQSADPQPVSSIDKAYFQQSAQDSVFQLTCAQLAIENSLSPDIRQLGMQIVQDHAQGNIMLLNFVHDHDFSVPVTLSGEDSKEVRLLQGLHGSAFDLAYAKEVTATHADEIDAANAELSNTLNTRAQNLVTMMRDTLRQHLTAANEVAQKMGLTTGEGNAATRSGYRVEGRA